MTSPRPLWTRPSVIVTREKHDPRYLDATTEDAFQRSALALLRERFDSGDYYDRPEDLAKEPPVDMDEAALAFIPDGSAAHRLHEQQVSARAR
jgi:hypothetical protein